MVCQYLAVVVAFLLAVPVQGQDHSCYYSYSINASYSPGCVQYDSLNTCGEAPYYYCFSCETFVDAIQTYPPEIACSAAYITYYYTLLVPDENQQIDSVVNFVQESGSVQIAGQKKPNPRLLCTKEGSGFRFQISNVILQNVAISNCSFSVSSTTRENNSSTYNMLVALYIQGGNARLVNVAVEVQPGTTGVVLYNPNGGSTVINSNFSVYNDTSLYGGGLGYGGGGFVLEYTYCQPSGFAN